jgi:hypothetical protein
VEVEDRLARSSPHVHDDTIILQAGFLGGLGDEVEHPLGLVGRELGDLAEGRDVPLGQHEQVGVGLRSDVADRDEAVGGVDVLAFADERAEEAVLRQPGSPPR